MKTKILYHLSIVIVLAMLLASCAPTAPATEAPAAKPTEAPVSSAPEATSPPVEPTKPPEPTAPPAPPAEKVLTIAVPEQYTDTFDISTMVYSMEPTSMIFDKLVVMDKDYRIQPGLAESWEVTPDGKLVTFHLKKGVTFTDGSPFNCEVVKWWIGRMNAPDGASNYMYSAVKEVECVDDNTAVFHFDAPYPALLWYLSTTWGSIMSKAAYEKYGGADFGTKHPVGSGPFILQEWVENDHLTLVKNPDYNWGASWTGHKGPANVDKIVYRIIPEAATSLVEFDAGNVDVILGPPWREIPTYQNNPDYKVLVVPNATIWFIGMNLKFPLVADLRTRQAIGYALDRDLIKETLFQGLGEAKLTYLASEMQSDVGVKEVAIGYDQAKSKELLAAAGWEMGSDGVLVAKNVDGVTAGTKFEVNYMTYNDDESKKLAEVTQKMLGDVGIKANIQMLDKPTYDSELKAGNAQVILRRYEWDGEDILPWFLAAYNLPYPNYLNVNDPVLDKMFADAEAMPTWDERIAKYIEAHKYLITKLYPWAPFYQRPSLWFIHSYVDITPIPLRGSDTETWLTVDIKK